MESQLEIFIFTYNRAASLQRTLGQFETDPVRKCRITVLDNHSTDATPEVCRAAAEKLPGLRIVRHPKNIGGLANYLRAIELAQAPYTWIVCDDDSFDFSKAKDIFSEIVAGKTDVISVGVEGHALPHGARSGLSAFARRQPFFIGHSFVPSTIFRTALFDADCLRAGYDNIDTMFPHFPFLIRVVESDRSIYVSKENVISKSNNVGYSTFRFMTGWLKSSQRIADQSLREKVVSEVFGGQALLKTLIFSALTERQFRPAQYRREFKDLRVAAAGGSLLIWLKVWLAMPLILSPEFVHKSLWNRYSAYRARRGSSAPNFDESR